MHYIQYSSYFFDPKQQTFIPTTLPTLQMRFELLESWGSSSMDMQMICRSMITASPVTRPSSPIDSLTASRSWAVGCQATAWGRIHRRLNSSGWVRRVAWQVAPSIQSPSAGKLYNHRKRFAISERTVLFPAISWGIPPESQIPPEKHPNYKNIKKCIKFTPPPPRYARYVFPQNLESRINTAERLLILPLVSPSTSPGWLPNSPKTTSRPMCTATAPHLGFPGPIPANAYTKITII